MEIETPKSLESAHEKLIKNWLKIIACDDALEIKRLIGRPLKDGESSAF